MGKSSYLQKSLTRGIEVLLVLADHPSLSVEQLSRVLGCSKIAAYRTLATLRAKHMVTRDPTTARYQLGLGILRVQRAVLRNLPVRMAAFPVMRDLASRCEETVTLFMRQGDFAVAVDSIESAEPVRVAPLPGESLPLHCGAPQKAILAFLPDMEIERYLRRKLERYTPHTICDPRELRRHLIEIRDKGYAESAEEVYVGGAGVAVPILGFDGYAIGSVAITGPTHRLGPRRVNMLAQMLVAAGKDVSRTLQLAD